MRLPPGLLLMLLLLTGALVLNACAPVPSPTTPTSTLAPSPTASLPAPTSTVAPSLTPTVAASPTSAPTEVPSATSVLTVAASPTTAPSATSAPTATSSTLATNLAGDPQRGAQLFPTLPCTSCHDITHPFPGGLICPNLGNISTEAALIVKSPDYHGKATDAAGYIRESIMNPNAYIVPGAQYRQADGQSVMPKNFAQVLTPQQIDDLVAYLMTQTDGALPTPTATPGK